MGNCSKKKLPDGDYEVTIKSFHKFLTVLHKEINDVTYTEEGVYVTCDQIGNAVKKALT